MKPLLRLLRAGRPVVLFPEGRIARNAAVMKVYPIPALIALKSGAAVLPVHVEGAGQWFSRSGSASVVRRFLPSVTMRVFTTTRIDGGAAEARAGGAPSPPAGSPRSCKQWRCSRMHASRCSSAFLDAVRGARRNAVLMEDSERGAADLWPDTAHEPGAVAAAPASYQQGRRTSASCFRT